MEYFTAQILDLLILGVYYSTVIVKDAKRYIYKVLVQIVQMWHLDNSAKRYIYKVLVQMVQTKNFRRLRRADCLVLISSLQQSLSPSLYPLFLIGLLIYRNRIGSLLSVHFV